MREAPTPGRPFGRRFYYADGEIDRICLDALESVRCMPATPSPVEIDLFLEKRFGCVIEYADLSPGVLGFAVFGDGGTLEAVGAARTLFDDGAIGERRARATLAHEAGHGLLHAELFSEAPEPHSLLDDSFDYERRRIMCRKEDLALRSGRYGGKWWEWQANQAIGGLLLPRRLVEECVEPLTDASGSLGPPALPVSQHDQAVRLVATTFDVNPVVARIRLDSILPPATQLSL